MKKKIILIFPILLIIGVGVYFILKDKPNTEIKFNYTECDTQAKDNFIKYYNDKINEIISREPYSLFNDHLNIRTINGNDYTANYIEGQCQFLSNNEEDNYNIWYYDTMEKKLLVYNEFNDSIINEEEYFNDFDDSTQLWIYIKDNILQDNQDTNNFINSLDCAIGYYPTEYHQGNSYYDIELREYQGEGIPANELKLYGIARYHFATKKVEVIKK